MLDRNTLHAELIAYCERIGAAPTTFGQFLFGDTGFAERLRRGAAPIGKVALAQRFMRDNPVVPHRQFGAVAKAWRKRLGDGAAGAGEAGGGAVGAADQAAASGGDANGNGAAFTAALIEQGAVSDNQESCVEAPGSSPGAPQHDEDGPARRAAVRQILDALGGHEAVAEGARIAVTSLEAMAAEGGFWTQHHRALADLAERLGFDLDPARLALRPIRERRAAG